MAGTLRRSAVPMARYAAFISYSSRYKDWVATLSDNLELCLPRHGEEHRVFFDQTGLGVGEQERKRGDPSGSPLSLRRVR